MTATYKKILLAGTALMALNLAAPAHAAPPDAQPVGTGTVVIDGDTLSNVEIDHDPHASVAIQFEYYDGTAQIDDNVNITGAIATDYDGYGSIGFVGTSKITGQVGSSDYMLRAISVANDGDVTFNKGVFAQGMLVSGDYTTTPGSVTLNGASNSIGLVQFYGEGAINLNGDLTTSTGIDFYGYNGTLNVGEGVTITGNIGDTTNGAAGNVNFSGSATVDGQIGAVNKFGIGDINFNGGKGALVTITGSANAHNFNIKGAGAVDFQDTVTGDINFVADGAATFEGTYLYGGIYGTDGLGSATFTNSSAYVYGDISHLKALTLSGGASSTFYVDGSVYAADTTDLGLTAVRTTGDFTVGNGQTLMTTIDANSGDYGHVYADGDVTVDAGTKLKISFDHAEDLAVNDTFTIVDGSSAGSGGVATLTGTVGTAMITMTQVADTDSLVVKVTDIKTAAEIATGHNNQAAAAAFDDIAHGDVFNSLASAPTAAALNNILSTLYPDMSGIVQEAALSHTEHTQGLIEERIASLRDGSATGMAAGSSGLASRAWLEGYGAKASQDRRDGVDGYDANTGGAAFGIDTSALISDGVFGVAFNYGKTKGDGKGFTAVDTDIDSFGVMLYASKSLAEGAFLNGSLGYAYNQVDQNRHNLIFGLTGFDDYAASQYSAKATLGRTYMMGSTTLTPTVSVDWAHLSSDGYTEITSAGPTATIGSDDADMLRVGAGVEAGWSFGEAGGAQYKPALHAGYAYRAINDRIENQVSASGATYVVQGADPARSEFNAGAAFTYASTADWDLSATYDYTFKEDYDAHTGTVRGTIHF